MSAVCRQPSTVNCLSYNALAASGRPASGRPAVSWRRKPLGKNKSQCTNEQRKTQLLSTASTQHDLSWPLRKVLRKTCTHYAAQSWNVFESMEQSLCALQSGQEAHHFAELQQKEAVTICKFVTNLHSICRPRTPINFFAQSCI